MTTLIIATRNAHKVGEIRSILNGERTPSSAAKISKKIRADEGVRAPFDFKTLVDFPDAPKVVEDAATFAGNATKKSVELARWLGRQPAAGGSGAVREVYVLADDSGLEVDVLNGAPGVHSARFAATDAASGNSPDAANNAKLLHLLRDVPAEQCTARFRCVIALTPICRAAPANASPVCAADELELQTELFDGVCEGRIALAPSGKGGFGYDPLFVPRGFSESFAELGEEIKNGISHRARALEKLRQWFAR